MQPQQPPQKPAQRAPLSIDDVAIDFSTVKASTTASKSNAAGGGGGVAATGPLTGASMPALMELLDQQQQEQSTDGRQRVSDVRAFDPSLQGVAQRQLNFAAGGAAVGRRKKVFGGQPYVPPSSTPNATTAAKSEDATKSGEAVSSTVTADGNAASASGTSAAQDALDFIITAKQKQEVGASALDVQRRREAYTQQLRSFCQRGRGSSAASAIDTASAQGAAAVFPSASPSQTNSMHMQLFADGVPDIEPWDRWTSAMPRYGEAKHLVVNPATATQRQIHEAGLDLVHHPVIPDSHYTRHHQYRDVEHPILQKEFKTKEELKAERREKLKEKQQQRKREREAATSAAATLDQSAHNTLSAGTLLTTTSAASRLLHDRLSTKSLALNMFGSSVLNPLAADSKVLEQYEMRFLEHQRRNHDRHVAALPNQILKRERDQQRFATENPLLRAYRVFPIYSPAHLGKLRHYANDNLLRGFVLYVADCDALLVLAGGEKAVRHLDHWIVSKMTWEHPDTRATRLLTVPLQDAETFSFHLAKAQAAAGSRVYKQGKLVDSASAASIGVGAGNKSEKGNIGGGDGDGDRREAVFINMVTTVEEGEKFMRQLPAPPSPWADLSGIWRSAFLQDGLQQT